MLIDDLVSASRRVAATRSRKGKVAALAEALRAAGPADVAVVVSYLAGSLRQRRTGLGWRSLME
ncbi:MAG: ATP-dependent DNA ligase, partial [Microthrixaceae bacterium]